MMYGTVGRELFAMSKGNALSLLDILTYGVKHSPERIEEKNGQSSTLRRTTLNLSTVATPD